MRAHEARALTPERGRKGVRRIAAGIDQNQLSADMAELVNLALSLGADDAGELTREGILFDEAADGGADAVNLFVSAHWPLNYPNDSLKDALRAFSRAVFFRVKTPKDMPDYGHGPIMDRAHLPFYEKVSEIAAKVEAAAFYMGHHLTLGFGAGNCRAIYCAKQKRCMAAVRGRVCVNPYKARPSMIAAGLNPEGMADALKWPHWNDETGPLLAGIVFIA